MKKVIEHLREHTEGRAKLEQADIGNAPPLDVLRQTRWSPEFENLMRNRLIVGGFRYGQSWNGEHDYVEAMRRKIERYAEEGNTEILVDIANYALVEFVCGRHPKKHFHATDDKDHARRLP